RRPKRSDHVDQWFDQLQDLDQAFHAGEQRRKLDEQVEGHRAVGRNALRDVGKGLERCASRELHLRGRRQGQAKIVALRNVEQGADIGLQRYVDLGHIRLLSLRRQIGLLLGDTTRRQGGSLPGGRRPCSTIVFASISSTDTLW